MKIYGIDFETYWDQQYTLSKMTNDAYVHDPRFEVHGMALQTPDDKSLYFQPRDIPRVLASLPWGEIGVLCHHAHFDGYILRQHYRTPAPKLWLDTLSMARFCLPHGAKLGLGFLAERFGLPPKGTATLNTRGRRYATLTREEILHLADYAKHDNWLTKQVFLILLGRHPTIHIDHPFPVSELRRVDLTVRMFTDPVLRLNEARLRGFLADTQERKARMLRQCGLETRDDLMSNDKFAAALEMLGVDVPRKISPTTHKETLALSKKDPEFKELLEHEDDRVVALVSARLELKSTGDETRTQRLLEVAAANRPWPVYLNFCGAKQTDRWSGGNKQNPQNLRRGGALRDSIEAPPGHVIVVADSSQIEARSNAAQAGEHALLQVFRDKGDPYADLASEIYGRAINKKTDPLERQVGKTGVLGLGYGMGPAKFQLTLRTDPIMPIEMPLDFCEHVVHVYRKVKYKRIAAMWERYDDALRYVYEGTKRDYGWFETCKEGLRLPNGFVIRYDGLHHGEHYGKRGWFYVKRNRPVPIYGAKVDENGNQAIARNVVAEQMENAMRQEYTSALGHRLALMAHDEVVVVAPEKHAEAVLALLLEKMHTPPTWTPIQIPVAAEGGFALKYSDAK